MPHNRRGRVRATKNNDTDSQSSQPAIDEPPQKPPKNKRRNSSPQSDDASDSVESEYDVERVVGKRHGRSGIEYKLRWKGYRPADDTWEPLTQLNCHELIAEYERAHSKPGKTPANQRKSSEASDERSSGKKRPIGRPPKLQRLATKRPPPKEPSRIEYSSDESFDDQFLVSSSTIKSEPSEPPMDANAHGVLDILDMRIEADGKRSYLLRWADGEPDSWEPEEHVDAPDMVRQIEAKKAGTRR